MAVSLLRSPQRWTSAYRPVEYVFGSDRYPNQIPGEYGSPTIFIGHPTSAQMSLWPALEPDDIYVNFFGLLGLVEGDWIEITNTAGIYDGQFQVTKVLSVDSITISAPYATEVLAQGVISKVYKNYTVFARVTMSADPDNPVTYRLKPKGDGSGHFVLNLQDQAARTFKDPFHQIAAGSGYDYTEVSEMDQSIVQSYSVVAWEGYNIYNQGIPTFFEDKKTTFATDQRVVNCVHPYHEKDTDGNTLLDWGTELDDYLLKRTKLGRKFLTWGPRSGQKVGTSEAFYLAWVWDDTQGTVASTFSVRIGTFEADGTPIATTTTDIQAPALAGCINVGPAALGAIITSATAYYTVALRNFNVGNISETFTLYVDRSCGESTVRPVWQNKMGGLDQFTFKERTTEQFSGQRTTIQKPYMAIPNPNDTKYRGDWMERQIATDHVRSHRAVSRLVDRITLRWLARDLFESADVRTELRDGWFTPMILQTEQHPGWNSRQDLARAVIEYRLGVDNRSHRA